MTHSEQNFCNEQKSAGNLSKKQKFGKSLGNAALIVISNTNRTKCPFKDFLSHKCGRKGHLKAVCKSKVVAEHFSKTNEIYAK